MEGLYRLYYKILTHVILDCNKFYHEETITYDINLIGI